MAQGLRFTRGPIEGASCGLSEGLGLKQPGAGGLQSCVNRRSYAKGEEWWTPLYGQGSGTEKANKVTPAEEALRAKTDPLITTPVADPMVAKPDLVLAAEATDPVGVGSDEGGAVGSGVDPLEGWFQHPLDSAASYETGGTALPDAPSAVLMKMRAPGEAGGTYEIEPVQSHAPPPKSAAEEPYHWKGLLLQSFAFIMLEDAVRIMTASQDDRHILLDKPFWSDYWASLQQWNMRRWNDGDSVPVNYVGHPMQGAISGYIEVQNDPRGRDLKISTDRRYWNSRFRAFLWATVFSTQQKIGPLGEAAVFNAGGFTYPIGCPPHDPPCQAVDKRYTNNTGWVDFIITPVVGTLWLLGEDTIDRFATDPLVENHPHAFGYKVLRSGLNPTRSLANMLRGRYPWYRDYEHPSEYESPVVAKFDKIMSEEPVEHFDIHPHMTLLTVAANEPGCIGCGKTTIGAGVGVGVKVWRYLDITADLGEQPDVSPISSPNIGGSLFLGNFGARSGYTWQHFALKMTLAPGFASYSKTQAYEGAPVGRNYNFSTQLALSGDVRLNYHFAIRTTVQEMLIRYKSADRDPPGRGNPPRVSFLSHDNYINSTNCDAGGSSVPLDASG